MAPQGPAAPATKGSPFRMLLPVAFSVLIMACFISAGEAASTPPAWMQQFSYNNNVTWDGASAGSVTLAGYTKDQRYLAPSAGLLSVDQYDGDFSMNVTMSAYEIVQSGYQAQISLFVSPTNYTLGNYYDWPSTNVLNNVQFAYVRAKVFPTIDYTFGGLYSAAGPNYTEGGAGPRLQQGVLGLSRKAGQVSGFIQVGTNKPVPFPNTYPCATGPVLLGVQMLYGFNFSMTITSISISYDSKAPLIRPSPPPPLSPPPPPPPSPPPQPTSATDGTVASWKRLFTSNNNVTYDNATGAACLAGYTKNSYLAPSAGLLSVDQYDGDFQMNVSISAYDIVQENYQAAISLFMAPLHYSLGDYLDWPSSNDLNNVQFAYVRAKVFPTIDYTFGGLYSAAGPNYTEGGAGPRLQQGVLGLSRKAGQVSGFIQVGMNGKPEPFPKTYTCATGPVLLGVQLLYGFNFSVTISSISISYDSQTTLVRPPSPPPPPPPSPPPPPPPQCAVMPAQEHVYPGGYAPKGVGGGGAMSSFSISPYTDLWLVGTDMGSLFRSTNRGSTWTPINHTQMRMTNDMPFAPPVGFSADGQTLYFAPCWDPSKGMPCIAKRSSDAGVTWSNMDVNAYGATLFNSRTTPPNNKRPIRYWTCSTADPGLCYAATTGGLDRTADRGLTWRNVSNTLLMADSMGSFLDVSTTPPTMYHATPNGIYSWPDGSPGSLKTVVSGGVLSFAAGRDANGLLLVYVDNNSSFCEEVWPAAWGAQKNDTLKSCGRMWISTNGGGTFQTTQHYASKVHMADNNGRVVYSHGTRWWDRNYGVRVYKTAIPTDGGEATTTKVFDQMNLDSHYDLWPASRLEYSAVGIDVGYWDGGYYLFSVNQLNADEAGGSENFFLHITRDGGQHREAPFTRFRDCGSRTSNKRWSSTGLEPTAFYTVAHHPQATDIIYAGAADIRCSLLSSVHALNGGIVSEDGGDTWRVIDPRRTGASNSIYAFAFDPSMPNRVFIASGKWHDWPNEWYANPLFGNGGIFVSDDVGRSFIRVGSPHSASCNNTSCNDMTNDFLAVAYDAEGDYLYGGGHILGIARIKLGDGRGKWEWINEGLLGDDLWQNETIIPHIEIDPANGDVYCLLTGNRAIGSPRNMLNQPRTGIYWMPRGGSKWVLLRGRIVLPSNFGTAKPWYYPTHFAVDWSSGTPGNRSSLLLVDFCNNGISGACGIWKSSDGGATWYFKQQSDWPTHVTIDPRFPNRVYVSGARAASPWGVSELGGWGYGGFMFSDNGGESWQRDDANPFQMSMIGAMVDPVTSCKVYYATSGGGVLHGPAPAGLPGC